MLQSFKEHIDKKFPFLKESSILTTISGGLDSVVLTHFCHKMGLKISLAHCNFNLRGVESDEDESFITKLADDLDLKVFIEHFETEDFAKEHQMSIQMAARELRYEWFYNLAETLSFDYILTAHHADDNLETVLINLTRGTGISGLTGIPEIHDKIIRPLLPFSRQELEKYALQNQIKWREDSSNASEKYLRNKIRHQVIPILKEINPYLLDSFKNTVDNLNDTVDIVDESLNAVAKRAIVELDAQHIKFKISEFKKVNNPKAYLYEMFKEYGFTQWSDIVNLLDAQSGKQAFSETHRLIKDRSHLILSEIKSQVQNEIVLDKEEALNNKIVFPNGILEVTQVNEAGESDKSTIYIDKEKLSFPFTIRKWEDGDFFYPLGMKGKKKLGKYFKDEKLNLLEKENVWLLCSQENIVWVLGMRADERFKVSENTQRILKIDLNSK
mgnify:CR=1 FL=1